MRHTYCDNLRCVISLYKLPLGGKSVFGIGCSLGVLACQEISNVVYMNSTCSLRWRLDNGKSHHVIRAYEHTLFCPLIIP